MSTAGLINRYVWFVTTIYNRGLHGAEHEGTVFQRSRNGEGDILHRIHKSGLQYVQIGSDKEVSF